MVNGSKFWEITLSGSSTITRYGKIGTDGRTTKKFDFDDCEAAKMWTAAQCANKEKKGYKHQD